MEVTLIETARHLRNEKWQYCGWAWMPLMLGSIPGPALDRRLLSRDTSVSLSRGKNIGGITDGLLIFLLNHTWVAFMEVNDER